MTPFFIVEPLFGSRKTMSEADEYLSQMAKASHCSLTTLTAAGVVFNTAANLANAEINRLTHCLVRQAAYLTLERSKDWGEPADITRCLSSVGFENPTAEHVALCNQYIQRIKEEEHDLL